MPLRSYPLLVFGFHGCERAVAEKVLSGSEDLKPSGNDYDWLGSCLNLMDTSSNGILLNTYKSLMALGRDFPENKGKRHRLDTIVINSAIGYAGGIGIIFDAVRAAFIEGDPVFEGSDIMSDTHIQLCVRNPSCILSYFRPKLEGGGNSKGTEA